MPGSQPCYSLGMEYVKSVVAPIKQVAPYANLRGLMDDFSYVTQTVLLLQGETHLGRKPGGLRFTSLAARDSFAKVVLQDIQPPPQVNSLAFKIIERMDRLNNNRLWLAGHMRRGDCKSIPVSAPYKRHDRLTIWGSRRYRLGNGRHHTR